MGKRGPKPIITHEQRLNELRKHNIFDEKGKVRKESDPVWAKICDILNQKNPENPIKPRNLQTYVSQDRNKVLSKLNKKVSDNKQESDKKEDLNRKNPIDTKLNVEEKLINIQSNALYKPMIKETSTFPFTIFHLSVEAIAIVSSMAKGTHYIFGVVGSLCENFVAPDGSISETIFLYTLGINTMNALIPICQLSAEQCAVSLLTRFFNVCIKNGLPIPSKLTIDYLWNQYTAANSVFNVNLTYEKYLAMCFSHLQGKSKELPRCIIYTNIRFLIIKVKQWKCVNDHPLRIVKEFYIYCVILLSMQNTLHNFEDILQKLFAFIYSRFQTEISKQYFDYLMSKIKELKINILYGRKNTTNIESEFQEIAASENIHHIEYHECETLVNYIKYIFIKSKECIPKSSKENENKTEENAFYNEDFCKHVIQLCVEFVIWSKVMYKDADDCSTEDTSATLLNSYKHEFENRLLCTKTPADKYLLENIDYVEEKIEIIRDSVTKKQEIKTKEIINFEDSYLLYEENWMGLNPQEKLDYMSDSEENSKSYISEDEDQLELNSDNEDEDDVQIQFNEKKINEIVDSICEELENQNVIDESGPIIVAEKDIVADSVIDDCPIKQNKDTVSKLRGKYLRQCDEINLINQKPLYVPKKRSIIRNYNDFKPKNGQSILTSSYFDSILEICTSTYFNISKFQNFVDSTNDVFEETKHEFFTILHNYVSTLNYSTLYTGRAQFLSKVCHDKCNGKLMWTKPIGDFFSKVVFSNIFIRLLCLDCDTFIYQYSNRIKLSAQELISEDISTLIYNKLEIESKFFCEECQEQLMLFEFEIKHLLCLDIEDNDVNSKSSLIKLDDLNISIMIGDQTLILIGVIEFEEPIKTNRYRHYIAYCRTVTGSWLKYNDAAILNKPVKIKATDQCINTALVIYAEYSTTLID